MTDAEDGAGDVDVEVNEDALEDELERRTISPDVPIDDVHATAVEQLEDAGVDVETELAKRLRGPVENTIHQILQESKYSN